MGRLPKKLKATPRELQMFTTSTGCVLDVRKIVYILHMSRLRSTVKIFYGKLLDATKNLSKQSGSMCFGLKNPKSDLWTMTHAKWSIWYTTNTVYYSQNILSRGKHGGGSIRLCRDFSSDGTEVVKVMNCSEYLSDLAWNLHLNDCRSISVVSPEMWIAYERFGDHLQSGVGKYCQVKMSSTDRIILKIDRWNRKNFFSKGFSLKVCIGMLLSYHTVFVFHISPN